MKELIAKHKLVFQCVQSLTRQLDTATKELSEIETSIKVHMTDNGMSSFDTDYGAFSINDKLVFNIKAADKDAMIAWFKSDPELKHLVKVKEDVNYQSANKVWRDLYNDTNAVPPFVEVTPLKLLDFKPAKISKED